MSETPPVAFLVFARPDTTAKVWAAIRRARPKRLLVVADAARRGRADEAERVAAVRRMIKPDWPCRVQRLYASENLGCGKRISSGLDWVFSQVPEAIILEDDCLPHADFFGWCRRMLARYRHVESVMSVGGSSALPSLDGGAHFSRYSFIWGWATWRRAWQGYDFGMRRWPERASSDWLRQRLPDKASHRFWREVFWDVHDGRVDTWDYQWTFHCWQREGLSLVPPVNLVTNVGFDNATHPTEEMRTVGELSFPLPSRLLLPAALVNDAAWDDRIERYDYSGHQPVRARRILKRYLRQLAARAGLGRLRG